MLETQQFAPTHGSAALGRTSLSLVVLDLHQTAAEGSLPKDTEKFVGDIVKQHGQSFRVECEFFRPGAYIPASCSPLVNVDDRFLADRFGCVRPIDHTRSVRSFGTIFGFPERCGPILR